MEMHFHSHHSTVALVWVILVCGLVILAYLYAVLLQFRRSRYWSAWRSTWFVIGILLVGIACSPTLEELAHRSFTAHMMQHLLIGMFAPIALVFSAPIILLLRSLPVTAARRLVSQLHSPWCYWISHPVTTLLLNIGGMYLLYLTPLYELSLKNMAIHYLVHWHFLVAGYLFVWSLVGPDPLPRRPVFKFRIFILFVGIAAHAVLAKLVYAQLIPNDAGHSVAEIQNAAKLMYYGGDIAEIIIALILLASAYRYVPVKRR